MNKSCCFTGHRNVPAEDYIKIKKRLEVLIENLILQGVNEFYTGGALGFDTMAAIAVLKLRAEHPKIKLKLALPCTNQNRAWKIADINKYNFIKENSDKIYYIAENYFNGCMQKRNRYMVDNSDICVCYLTKSSGGTAYTINYAKSKGVRLINITDIILK